MSLLLVKPQSAEDISRHLSVFSVDENASWVGHGQNMLYRPRSEADFGATDESDVILARSAFATERSIVGRRLIIPEGRLGQVAVLSSITNDQESLTAAIAIPAKIGWLSRVSEVISYVPIPSRENVTEDLTKPSVFMHTTIRNALFELINAEPAQLTRSGE